MEVKRQLDKIEQRLDELNRRVRKLERKVFPLTIIKTPKQDSKCASCGKPIFSNEVYCKRCAAILEEDNG
jgi:predicted amidophosphoribosyltransferase